MHTILIARGDMAFVEKLTRELRAVTASLTTLDRGLQPDPASAATRAIVR